MIDTLIFLADNHNQATVVNEFEETLLRIFIVVIMFGLGAGLTPKDFGLPETVGKFKDYWRDRF